MKIALAQTNPTIGDIAGNTAQIADAIHRGRDLGAQLIVFPELAVLGYPPKDLLLKTALVDHCVQAVEQLAISCTDVAALIGYPYPSEQSTGRSLYNAVAFCYRGQLLQRHAKSLLPTYDVFDESRYFEPARPPEAQRPIGFAGVQWGITICEDLWNDREMFDRQLYHDDPVQSLVEAGSQVIVNCSASPFVVDKHNFRRDLFARIARLHRRPIVFCNQVGGNDDLVFDGNSCVLDADGKLIAHAKSFETDLLQVELPVKQPGADGNRPHNQPDLNRIENASAGTASIFQALVLGLRDYCQKCGFKSVVMGLSGGIDSAVTGALSVAAMGKQHVHGVAMPSRYSSEGSIADARALAKNLDIEFHEVPIENTHAAFDVTLNPHFKGLPPDTTEENVQARIRGVILMAFSNKFGALLVTTGNKSELAVGYCTLYGDMCGGMAVLSDVPKTMVWKLAQWINCADTSPLRRAYGRPVIPEQSITKPPSAELRPDQTDQDSLPPYELLDQIIERYVEQDQSPNQIIDEVSQAERDTVMRIIRLIDRNEYKRNQAAPGLKVTGRAFGFGRRIPIAKRCES